MNKPDSIGISDWKELLNKYDGKIPTEIEEKLLNNYPIQYLIGNVEFLNSNIKVNESVLIPRYETELLVQKTINKIQEGKIDSSSIIDLCTGSGVIAINLSSFSDDIDALDISKDAICLAKENAQINNSKINFIIADLLKDKIDLNHSLIISNPPYVKSDEYVGPETKYEPQIALFAEDDGLEFYKRILDLSTTNKMDKFCVAFEIGSTQNKQIIDYAKGLFKNVTFECEQDFNGLDRFIFIYVNKCNN